MREDSDSEDEIQVLFEKKSKRKQNISTKRNDSLHLSIPISKVSLHHHNFIHAGYSKKIINSWPSNDIPSAPSSSQTQVQSHLLFLRVNSIRGIEFSNHPGRDETLQSSSRSLTLEKTNPIPPFLPNSIHPNQLREVIVTKKFQKVIQQEDVKTIWNPQVDKNQLDDKLVAYQLKIVYQEALKIQVEKEKEIIVISSDDDDEGYCKNKIKKGSNNSSIRWINLDDDDDNKEEIKKLIKQEDSPMKNKNYTISSNHKNEENRRPSVINCNLKLTAAIEPRETELSNEVEISFKKLDQFINHLNLDLTRFLIDYRQPQNQYHPTNTQGDQSQQRQAEIVQINHAESSISTINELDKGNNRNNSNQHFQNNENSNRNEIKEEKQQQKAQELDLSTSCFEQNPIHTPDVNSDQNTRQNLLEQDDKLSGSNRSTSTINTAVEQKKNDHKSADVAQKKTANHKPEDYEHNELEKNDNTTPQTSPTPILNAPSTKDISKNNDVEKRNEINHGHENKREVKLDSMNDIDEKLSYDSLFEEERYNQTRINHSGCRTNQEDVDDQNEGHDGSSNLISHDDDTLDFLNFVKNDFEYTAPHVEDDVIQGNRTFNSSQTQTQPSNFIVNSETSIGPIPCPIPTSTPSPLLMNSQPDHESSLWEKSTGLDFYSDLDTFQTHLIVVENRSVFNEEMMMVDKQVNDDNNNEKNNNSQSLEKGKKMDSDRMAIDDVPTRNPSNPIPADRLDFQHELDTSQPSLILSNQATHETVVVNARAPQQVTMSDEQILDSLGGSPSPGEETSTAMDISVSLGPSAADGTTSMNIPISPESSEEEGTTPMDIPVYPKPAEQEETPTARDISIFPGASKEGAQQPINTPAGRGPLREPANPMDIPVSPVTCQATTEKLNSMAVAPEEKEEGDNPKKIVFDVLRDADSDPEDENYEPNNKRLKLNASDDDNQSSYTTEDSGGKLEEDSDLESLSSLDFGKTLAGSGSNSINNNRKKVQDTQKNAPLPSSIKSSGVQSSNHDLTLKNFFLEDYCQKSKQQNEKLKRKYKNLKNLISFTNNNKKTRYYLIHEKRIKDQLNKKNHTINILKSRLRKKDEKICEYEVNYQMELDRIQENIQKIEQDINSNQYQQQQQQITTEEEEIKIIEKRRLEQTICLLLLIQKDQLNHINHLQTRNNFLESQIKNLESSLFPL